MVPLSGPIPRVDLKFLNGPVTVIAGEGLADLVCIWQFIGRDRS